jgi:O-antigen/teichoic acid export membrane protein
MISTASRQWFADTRKRLKVSRVARQAAWIFVGNATIRAVGFFGSAYAARCLGPVNLGISALIQSLVQPLILLNGSGMDLPMVRHVAAAPSLARPVAYRILRFRLVTMLGLLLPGWLLGTWFFAPPAYLPASWLGAGLLFLGAFVNGPVYQALEQLPLLSAITLGGTAVTSLSYLIFFRPGMSAGSNLGVLAGSGLLTAIASWWLFFRISPARKPGDDGPGIPALMHESLPYWGEAMVAYFYSSFQIPLIAWFLSERQVGIYRTATVLTAAAEMFYSSVNSLMLPRLVKWRQLGPESLWNKQHEMLLISGICGGVVSLVLILGAPLIYRFMGPQFSEGVLPFQILVLARAVVFVGQIYSAALTALGMGRQLLTSSISGSVFSVAANVAIIPLTGLVGAAVVNLLTEILVHAMCFRHVRARLATRAGTL